MNTSGTCGSGNSRSVSWRGSATKKVFGREREIKQLDQILFEQREQDHDVASSPLVIIKGLAGSGKSSIVESYPWVSHGYCLAIGKFEAHRTAEPYSAVIQALDSLVEKWVEDATPTTNHVVIDTIMESVAEDEEAKAEEKADIITLTRREALQEVLRKDRKLLKEVIPSILRIAGVEDEQVQELSTPGAARTPKTPSASSCKSTKSGDFSLDPASDCSSASTDNVNAVFRRILMFLCSSSRPVLFCLDDVQWADAASLDVLQSLVSKGKIPGLLLAATYREEDVDEHHKLASRLEEFKGNGLVKVHDIHVQDLDIDGLNALVAHLVRRDENETLALTEVIHKKTNGNPFFVLELMTLLQYEKFLTYSYSMLKWEWGDVDEIEGLANISNNVADVVAATIHRLPEATQVALSVAACLGRKVVPLDVLKEYFDLLVGEEQAASSRSLAPVHVLDEIHGKGVDVVLSCAVQNGILTRTEDPSKDTGHCLKWSHDKLQQCAYALVPEPQRASLHMRLGKLLWRLSETNTGEEWMVFTAADQLNRFYSLKSEGDTEMFLLDATDVAKLNLKAAKLSLRKSALFPAMDMLRAGAKHVDGTSRWWNEHYDMCLELYSRLSVTGARLGQHEDVMKAVEEIDKNAQSIDDKFYAHCSMLTSITSGKDRDYDLGVEKTIEILRMYGEKIPKKMRPWRLYFEKRRLKSHLPPDGLKGLLDLPKMEDGRALKVTKLLVQYLNFFAIHSQKYEGLRPLATLRSLHIACKGGLCEMAASGVLGFAIDLKCANHYQEALSYGQFAIGLVDKFPQRCGSSHCTVRLRATSAVFCAVLPFGTCLEKLLEAHRIGLKVGDTEKALCAIVSYAWAYLCVGLPIGPFQSDLISYGREARTFKLPYPMQVLFKVWGQAMVNLQIDGCENPTLLKGDVMDEEEELTKVQGSGKKMTLRDINSMRLMLACIFNDLDTAREMVDALEEYLAFDILISRAYFRTTYIGLAALRLARKTGLKKYRTLGKKALKFFKNEVQNGSVNAFPILAILEAEEYPSKAAYETAIKTCARLGLSHHEAYMCEMAGFYFLKVEDDTEWAKIYLDRALSLYKDWGASGKVHAMRSNLEYSDILTPMMEERISHNTALKGKRRFTKRDSNLLKAVMGMISRRAL